MNSLVYLFLHCKSSGLVLNLFVNCASYALGLPELTFCPFNFFKASQMICNRRPKLVIFRYNIIVFVLLYLVNVAFSVIYLLVWFSLFINEFDFLFNLIWSLTFILVHLFTNLLLHDLFFVLLGLHINYLPYFGNEKWYLYNHFVTTFSLILTLYFYFLSVFFSLHCFWPMKREKKEVVT